MVELATLLVLGLGLWWGRSYQSSAQLRMLFWHPQGTPRIPAELASESGTRKVLLSSTVRERVNRRLSWQLSQEQYENAVGLSSNHHQWNVKSGVYLKLTAVAKSPQRSRLLCQVASEEFSGRCQELSQEFDQLFWEIELAKVQGPLEQWRYRHKVPDQEQLRKRAKALHQRLLITIAATQRKLRRLKDGSSSVKSSERTVALIERLRELEAGLDELWLQGVDSSESVNDLEREQQTRRVELQRSFRADQTAALNGIESVLEKLQSQESRLSPEAVSQAAEEFAQLQGAVGTLNRAKDLALEQLSMYCYVFRKPEPGRLLAASRIELLLTLACLLLLCASLFRRRGSRSDSAKAPA